MSEPLQVQQALEALRSEIQIDRIAVQQSITDGFDKMSGKFDAHADQDRQMFADMNDRLQDVEAFQTWVLRIAIGLTGTISTGLIGWALSKL